MSYNPNDNMCPYCRKNPSEGLVGGVWYSCCSECFGIAEAEAAESQQAAREQAYRRPSAFGSGASAPIGVGFVRPTR